MKTTLLTTAIASSFLFCGAPTLLAEKEMAPNTKIMAPIDVSTPSGATLWDFKGNEIGEIETILLGSGDTGALAVIDTSILEEDRKIVVPYSVLTVKTKADDADDIMFALDADVAKLEGAPKYNGEPMSLGTEGDMMPCCTYWMDDAKKAEMMEKKAKMAPEKAE